MRLIGSRLRAAFALGALVATASLPGSAAGHGGGLPWIYIEAVQVWPGQPFHVLVLDVAPFVNVTLEAEAGERRATLGQLVTGPAGHGEVDVTLPADFPLGYAQLHGRGDDGSLVSTELPVGDLPDRDGPAGPPRPGDQPGVAAGPWWSDPSVLTLGALVGGAGLLLAGLALRQRGPRPVATPSAARLPRRRKARR
jgi:hypothetical protein